MVDLNKELNVLKIKTNRGGGGGGSGWWLKGVKVDVNEEVKLLRKFKTIRVCSFSIRNPYMKFQDDISFRNIIVAKFQGPKF